MDLTTVDRVVNGYLQESAQLVPILQDVQREYGFLPEEVVHRVAEWLHISLSRVYSAATFYSTFSLTPRGRHLIRVCTGTACHLRGSTKLLDVLQGKFELEDGQTSPDRRFTLKRVNCLGACALAPVVVVDDAYFDGMTPGKLLGVLERYE